jgi:phosphoribosylamine---glycine ligase
MRVLIVGSGGREHALFWALSKEAEVFVAPGNPGIPEGFRFAVSAEDAAGIADLARRLTADLVLIGPEAPLIAGVADELRAAGFAVLGPGAEGAFHEASKQRSREMMQRAGVPVPRFYSAQTVRDAVSLSSAMFESGSGVVVKASGAALGKGVVVCSTPDEAEDAIQMMLVDEAFGEAGRTVLIEERLTGREFSLLSVCSGERFVSLPVAQDYKRALDRDRGPNTGGMGSYSPVPWIDDDLVEKAEAQIVAPILRMMKSEGIDYRGVLFSGIMVQQGQPYCLEYNVRFGDPETQSVVRRLGPGLADLLLAAAQGEELPKPQVLPNAAVTVVLASGGYPGSFPKGVPITLPTALPEGVELFHAGTAMSDRGLVTGGGRVLAVSAAAPDLADARRRAYETCGSIAFAGMHYRRDIAGEPL